MRKTITNVMTVAVVAMATLAFTATPAKADMYALYQFEDASGTVGSTIADSSPSNHNGTVITADIGLVAGKAGKCVTR